MLARARLQHCEPVFLSGEAPNDDGIFIIEARVEVLARRGRGQGGRHGQAALGIERYDHGGITPTRRPEDVNFKGHGCAQTDVSRALNPEPVR